MFSDIFTIKDGDNKKIKSISSSDFIQNQPLINKTPSTETIVTENSKTLDEPCNLESFLNNTKNTNKKLCVHGGLFVIKQLSNKWILLMHGSELREICKSADSHFSANGNCLTFFMENGMVVAISYKKSELKFEFANGIRTIYDQLEWFDMGQNFSNLCKQNKGKAIMTNTELTVCWYYYSYKLVMFYKRLDGKVKSLHSLTVTVIDNNITFCMENGIFIDMWYEDGYLIILRKNMKPIAYKNTDSTYKYDWIEPLLPDQIRDFKF